MDTFEITVIETNKMVMTVEADSYEEAVEKAEAEYFENPARYIGMWDVDDTTFE